MYPETLVHRLRCLYCRPILIVRLSLHPRVLIWLCPLHRHPLFNTKPPKDRYLLRHSALSISNSPGDELVSTLCLLINPNLLSPLVLNRLPKEWIHHHSTSKFHPFISCFYIYRIQILINQLSAPPSQPTSRPFPSVQRSLQPIGPTGCINSEYRFPRSRVP